MTCKVDDVNEVLLALMKFLLVFIRYQRRQRIGLYISTQFCHLSVIIKARHMINKFPDSMLSEQQLGFGSRWI